MRFSTSLSVPDDLLLEGPISYINKENKRKKERRNEGRQEKERKDTFTPEYSAVANLFMPKTFKVL